MLWNPVQQLNSVLLLRQNREMLKFWEEKKVQDHAYSIIQTHFALPAHFGGKKPKTLKYFKDFFGIWVSYAKNTSDNRFSLLMI